MPLVLKITLIVQLLLAAWAFFWPRTFLSFFRGQHVPPDVPRTELRPIRLLGVLIFIITLFWYLVFIGPRYGWW